MIKNIYDKVNKQYRHNYYCDNCFKVLDFSKIYRNDLAIQKEIFDLCISCKYDWDKRLEIDLLVKEEKK